MKKLEDFLSSVNSVLNISYFLFSVFFVPLWLYKKTVDSRVKAAPTPLL